MEALGANVGVLADENVRDGALIAVDNRTGEVLAYVGNTGAAGTLYVDGVRAKRQAGSTLKPFLYGLAFEKRLLDDASPLEDSSLHVPTGLGIYTPENYDRTHKGLVPARVALASSLNVPAVRVLMLVGTEAFVEKLSDLGVGPLQEGAYYGYSLALGSLDVSLWELVNAYRTIANGGIYGDLTFEPAPRKQRGKRVFPTEAAALVADILADREARGMTFGFENPLATRFWTASKTGTSKDMRDNWCIGFSNRYTVGVWVGNFSGEPMRNVSGVTGAAPVWLEVMNYLHRGLPSETPMRLRVARKSAAPPIEPGPVSAGKDPYFVTAHGSRALPGIDVAVPPERTPAPLHTRITYPPEGTLIAMDPDIPYANQRVFFEASQGTRLVWVLDGERAGEGRVAGWNPRRGRHLLQLVDGDGSLLDEVRFRVTE
jgi:penicillin-binding protein 1C